MASIVEKFNGELILDTNECKSICEFGNCKPLPEKCYCKSVYDTNDKMMVIPDICKKKPKCSSMVDTLKKEKSPPEECPVSESSESSEDKCECKVEEDSLPASLVEYGMKEAGNGIMSWFSSRFD